MPSMPDAPLTHREFREFQTRLFVHLDRKFAGMDDQFGAMQSQMNGRFDEVYGHLDGIVSRLDQLETEYQMILVGLRRVEESRG